MNKNAISKLTVAVVIAVTAMVIVLNVSFLYSAPVPNSFNWWQGDETWLMAQSRSFVTTGHYINPLAPGSEYSECSGLLFGSCYFTAMLYGIPLLIVKDHSIEVGRTISLLFAVATLLMLWIVAKRYEVPAILRALGCLLLASTLCFFITSHCARSDTLIGLSILALSGFLPLIIQKSFPKRDIILGLILPLCPLVNGHVLILAFPMIGYITWNAGCFKHPKLMLRMGSSAVAGFALLLIAQEALLGSSSLLGPFSGSSGRMPIMRIIHPKADLSNLNWRLFIANVWAPSLLWISIVLFLALVWARVRFGFKFSNIETAARRSITCVALAIIPSILLEYYEPRYFIYVLPSIVLAFLILFSQLLKYLGRCSQLIISLALSSCLVIGIGKYWTAASKLGESGNKITSSNKAAVSEALKVIHSHFKGVPRIYSTVTGEAVAMDDSCTLVTPIMYYNPIHTESSREDLWKNAEINFAIVCNPAHNLDWNETDSSISWLDRIHAKKIFERVGPLWDIGRSYDTTDLRLLDTLRAYEFE